MTFCHTRLCTLIPAFWEIIGVFVKNCHIIFISHCFSVNEYSVKLPPLVTRRRGGRGQEHRGSGPVPTPAPPTRPREPVSLRRGDGQHRFITPRKADTQGRVKGPWPSAHPVPLVPAALRRNYLPTQRNREEPRSAGAGVRASGRGQGTSSQ